MAFHYKYLKAEIFINYGKIGKTLRNLDIKYLILIKDDSWLQDFPLRLLELSCFEKIFLFLLFLKVRRVYVLKLRVQLPFI